MGFFCLIAAIVSANQNFDASTSEMAYIWGCNDERVTNIMDCPEADKKTAADYYDNGWYWFFIKFWNYVILFTNWIPITYVVTMEFCKLAQALLMQNDLQMYVEWLLLPAIQIQS